MTGKRRAARDSAKMCGDRRMGWAPALPSPCSCDYCRPLGSGARRSVASGAKRDRVLVGVVQGYPRGTFSAIKRGTPTGEGAWPSLSQQMRPLLTPCLLPSQDRRLPVVQG